MPVTRSSHTGFFTVTGNVYLGAGYDRRSLGTAAWFVSVDTRLL